MARDATWDAIEETARRINDEDASIEFTVVALRRRYVNEWTVREGLHLGNRWTDVFEDVRTRRFFRDKWCEVQSIRSAEANVRDRIRRLSGPLDNN